MQNITIERFRDCPFCGHSVFCIDENADPVTITCDSKGCGASVSGPTFRDALRKWNRRSAETNAPANPTPPELEFELRVSGEVTAGWLIEQIAAVETKNGKLPSKILMDKTTFGRLSASAYPALQVPWGSYIHMMFMGVPVEIVP